MPCQKARAIVIIKKPAAGHAAGFFAIYLFFRDKFDQIFFKFADTCKRVNINTLFD